MKIIVIIPAYNEAKKIFNIVQGARQFGYEVAVVDDGSSDATATEAARAGAVVLRHLVNRGYGAALTTGNRWALRQGYEIIVHFDADGQHEPADIQKLVEPIMLGRAEAVLGSRFLNPLLCKEGVGGGFKKSHVPFFRRLFIKLAILFTWIFSGVKLTDAHNGLRAFSARALRQLDCHQDGMAYSSEIIDQIMEHKLRFLEVPVTVRYTDYARAKGESNLQKILVGLKFLWGKVVR